MLKYEDSIILKAEWFAFPLKQVVDDAVDIIESEAHDVRTEYSGDNTCRITFMVQADDLWDLFEQVQSILSHVSGFGVHGWPDKSKVTHLAPGGNASRHDSPFSEVGPHGEDHDENR